MSVMQNFNVISDNFEEEGLYSSANWDQITDVYNYLFKISANSNTDVLI